MVSSESVEGASRRCPWSGAFWRGERLCWWGDHLGSRHGFRARPEAASAFFRDVLEFPCAHTGDGWLRFVPPTELSVHSGGDPGVAEGQHKLYLACDDIERTVEELERKGVEFVDSIADQGCGSMTRFKVPGAGEVGLVQAGRSA